MVFKDIDHISKIFKLWLNGSQGFVGTRLLKIVDFQIKNFQANHIFKHFSCIHVDNLVDPKSRIMGLGDPWYFH